MTIFKVMTILNSVSQSVKNQQYFEQKQDDKQERLLDAIKNHASLEDIAIILLTTGASKDRKFQEQTPLSIAMEFNHFSVFSYLVDNLQADIGTKFMHLNKYEYPLVWYALWENKMDYFKLLLNRGGKNIRDPENQDTLLIAAVKAVNPDAVKFCLDSKKIDVNAVDNKRRTALHHALSVPKIDLSTEHQQIIGMLMEAGANPSLIDLNGRTPMDSHRVATLERDLIIQQEMEETQKPKNNYKKKKTYGLKSKSKGLGVK